MASLFDRVLPGFMPCYIRLEVITDDRGYLTLTVFAGEGPGFVTKDLVERYEGLTLGEASDVVEALFSGWAGT